MFGFLMSGQELEKNIAALRWDILTRFSLEGTAIDSLQNDRNHVVDVFKSYENPMNG